MTRDCDAALFCDTIGTQLQFAVALCESWRDQEVRLSPETLRGSGHPGSATECHIQTHDRTISSRTEADFDFRPTPMAALAVVLIDRRP
jgi:hypothetical protein